MSRRLTRLLLAALAACLLTGCGVAVRTLGSAAEAVADSSLFWTGRHGRLTDQETAWAKTAWRYFENNTNPSTGLVNAVDKYPTTTMWHVADYLSALAAARELGLIDERKFDERLSGLLAFLNYSKLFRGQLPNRSYNAQTGEPVDYANKPGEIGWSATDIGRLLIWLRIIEERWPRYAEYVDRIVLRWNYCSALNDDGDLLGAVVADGRLTTFPDGQPPLLEYAQIGFRLWGFDVRADRRFDMRNVVRVENIDLPFDSVGARKRGVRAPLLTIPFLLAGLEFHWDDPTQGSTADGQDFSGWLRGFADDVYEVHERRFQRERVMTARADYRRGQAPQYLYDTVWAEGYAWNTISDDGKSYPELALISTRAAFGLWALWPTSYTDRLIDMVTPLHDPDRGWFEGRYERTGGYEKTLSSATNAMVLQALLHKAKGRIYRDSNVVTLAEVKLGNEFENPGRCLPKLWKR
jgi:hypothetical protein